jgi:hypothetical protein
MSMTVAAYSQDIRNQSSLGQIMAQTEREWGLDGQHLFKSDFDD